MNSKKKSKDSTKTMTELIQECIKDGFTKDAIKTEVKKAFPEKTSDSIRTMVNKHFHQADVPAPTSPVKKGKFSKKELLELLKAKDNEIDTEVHSEGEA